MVNSASEIKTISIYGIDGGRVMFFDGTGFSSKIDIGKLQAGIYLLYVHGEQLQATKFVKQ